MPEPSFTDTAPALWPGRSGATSLDVSNESSIAALYRVAIGPVNTARYLRIFTRFEDADRAGPGWNWAASLNTLNWMAFRQLWWAAFVYVVAVPGVALLVFGLGRLVLQASETQALWSGAALCVAAFVIPGICGDALLYAHCRKSVARALAATATVPAASVILNRQASSRQRLAWLALANAVLAGAAVGAWIAYSQTAPVSATGTASPAAMAAPAASPASTSASVPASLLQSLTAAPPAIAPSATTPALAPASAPAVSTSAAAPSASAPDAKAQPVTSAASSPSGAASPPPTAPAVVTAPAHKAAASGPPAAKVTADTAQRYYINVGLFAQDSNAHKALARLLEAGLAAFTQELETANGKRTRVRVGPFDSRSEADSAAEKIHALQLDAVVFAQ